MRDRETPLPLLRKWLRSCPDAYQQLDNCEAAKADGSLSWPDYCPLPINAAYTYLTYARGRTDVEAAEQAAELTACWAWRRSRIIYSVDDDMAEMLFAQAEDMADTDVLPVDLLLHLPYPCIYVKAHHPELPGVDGFFAWIDYDANCASTELRVQWLYDDMQDTVPQVLHLDPSGTIGDCVRATLDRTRENVGVDISAVSDVASLGRIILGVIQIILYIISDGADIAAAPDHKHTQKIPRKPNDVGKASTVDLQYVGVPTTASSSVRICWRVSASFSAARLPPARRSTHGFTRTTPAFSPAAKIFLSAQTILSCELRDRSAQASMTSAMSPGVTSSICRAPMMGQM